MTSPRYALIALMLSLVLTTVARAEDDPPPTPPRHRLVYSTLTAARINPLGLVNESTIGYRLRLFSGPGALFQDTHISLQAYSFVSPADGDLGAQLIIKPLALLRLSAKVGYYGTFGTFGFMQSFTSPTAEHSDTDRDDRADQGLDYTVHGLSVTLSARLQAKVWRIAIRDTLTMNHADLDLKDGDTVFTHSTLDLMFPNGGWALTNELDVLYVTDFDLILGVQYTVVKALYPDESFRPGEATDDPNSPVHRLGPLAVYKIYKRPGGNAFNSLNLFMIVQWYAAHRYRTGADVSAALPRIVIGAAASGDFVPW